VSTIYIPQNIHEVGIQYLIDRGYEIKMGSGTTKEILMKEIVDCDAILARTETYSEEVLRVAKNLKVIGRHGVGTDNIDIESATRLSIQVVNAPNSNTNSVVEHVLCFMLALAKNVTIHNRELRKGHFEKRNELLGISIENKTLGIVGMGRIGKTLAERACQGFRMNIIGFDPFVTGSVDHVEMVTDWEQLFRQSDFISIHLPLTEKTKAIVGKKEFEWMKKSAFLINTSRGEVVNETELVDALKRGIIQGAGLDVFEAEPPSIDNELFLLDRVIVSPHNAALTDEALKKMALDAAIGIDEVLSGCMPTWPVNDLLKMI
jgi:D-3-phosphoglycerate dehydrogenase / 2-oxoglutarate reductase